ncbi:hypothetical protein R6M67_25830, partial [Streptomyces sp. Wh19]|nr:hypothetical protein [Streptomyces sp. Wh19]
MNSLLTEVGRKLADRWLSALVLPGALFVAAAMCGWWLGHPHALDTGRRYAGSGSSWRVGLRLCCLR